MAGESEEVSLAEIGGFLGIVSCSESVEAPTLLSVTDLACLGIPVIWETNGLVVAVPATVVPTESETFSPVVEVPSAEEGTWEVPAEGVAQGVCRLAFFVMGKESIESGLEVLWGGELDPADYVCFVEDSFIVPCAGEVLLAWRKQQQARRPAGRGRGRVLPGAKRGRCRGPGEADSSGKAGAKPVKETGRRTVAGLEKLLEEKLAGLEDRLKHVEGGTARTGVGVGPPSQSPMQVGVVAEPTAERAGSGPGGGAGGSTMLGVGGSRVDSQDALAQARKLLGVGATQSGGGLGSLGAPPGLSKGLAGGTETPKAPRETAAEGPEGVIELLLRALEKR